MLVSDQGGSRFRKSLQRYRCLPDRTRKMAGGYSVVRKGHGGQALRSPRLSSLQPGARLRASAGMGEGQTLLRSGVLDRQAVRHGTDGVSQAERGIQLTALFARPLDSSATANPRQKFQHIDVPALYASNYSKPETCWRRAACKPPKSKKIAKGPGRKCDRDFRRTLRAF